MNALGLGLTMGNKFKNYGVKSFFSCKASNVRPKIRFRRVSAKNKGFGKNSVSAKKWPNVRREPKQSVFFKSNLFIKHFRTFDLYYHG